MPVSSCGTCHKHSVLSHFVYGGLITGNERQIQKCKLVNKVHSYEFPIRMLQQKLERMYEEMLHTCNAHCTWTCIKANIVHQPIWQVSTAYYNLNTRLIMHTYTCKRMDTRIRMHTHWKANIKYMHTCIYI